MKLSLTMLALGTASLIAAAPVAADDQQQKTSDRQKAKAGQSAEKGQRLYGDKPVEDRLVLRLAKDAYVGKDFRIEVKDGTADLSGTVASEDDRDKILEIARNTPGITKVNARMQVVPATAERGPGMPDDQLARQVVSRTAKMIPGATAGADGITAPNDEAQITVKVDNGNVTLDGDVKRPATALAAIEAALQVQGISSVKSNIDTGDTMAGAMRGGDQRSDQRAAMQRDRGAVPGPPPDTFKGEHVMRGEVTKVDGDKGLVSVKSEAGPTLDLHFPPSALEGVKKGDRVAIELGIRPEPGASASPATDTKGNGSQGQQQQKDKH